jgi:hypothetical protein
LTTDGSTANADVTFVEGVVDSLQSASAGGGGAKFRDPIATSNIADPGFTDAAFDTYMCATTGVHAVDTALASVKASVTAFYAAAEMTGRNTRLEGGLDDVGTAVNCASFASDNTHGKWVTFSTACGTLLTNLNNRIAEIDARIGVPVYANSTHATGVTPAARSKPPCIRVKTIPTANATSGYVPYGREIYDNVNLLIGQDIDLLGGIIKDIESLGDLVDLVKNSRNKYEIYNGRVKEY